MQWPGHGVKFIAAGLKLFFKSRARPDRQPSMAWSRPCSIMTGRTSDARVLNHCLKPEPCHTAAAIASTGLTRKPATQTADQVADAQHTVDSGTSQSTTHLHEGEGRASSHPGLQGRRRAQNASHLWQLVPGQGHVLDQGCSLLGLQSHALQLRRSHLLHSTTATAQL